MKRDMIYLIVFSIGLLPQTLQAADMIRFQAVTDSSSRIQIDGTSTLHDWTVISQVAGGYIEMAAYVWDGALFNETSMSDTAVVPATVHVEIPVLSLQHDEDNDGLEERMYKALKYKEHPAITYHLTIGRRLPSTSMEKVRVVGSGNLTIAGFSRYIDLTIDLIRMSDKRLKVVGETSLKMTDYHIKKPKAMLGMIRTGDEVTIRFEWVTERSK
jgi:polyisoprenoid-binding protein YceI